MRSALTLSLLLTIAVGAEAQVVNGDFESGNTGFTSGYTFGNVANPGTYTIGTDPSTVPGSFPDWESFGDHTSGTGQMLIANGGTNASTPVWSETVPVAANTDYRFAFWGATLNTSSASPANIVVQINGVPVGGSHAFPSASPASGGAWVPFSSVWNSGASVNATIELFDSNTAVNFNDFALDDISLTASALGAIAPVMSSASYVLLALTLGLLGYRSRRRIGRKH